ncbi:pseudouridine synthase [Facklamia hominis]|uniref:pseudouridine synthase n=1 Tax=Facklamia hominis TaxID=178214 RepID=UPI0003546429|nr:pseudouridine synthase [Facklamia hominis]EPH13014.1 pseudouridine synthase [Facklamia hominis ACS-120-V-Sch10]
MERLQKVMAHAGVASRRKCEELITQGRVKVQGQVVDQLGVKVSPNDRIEVDGIPIYREEPRYILLYKPRNYISAVEDDKGRPVVVDLINGVDERIYPIGRLDFDTTGLLLLTNDGDFANRMMHPRFQVEKVYIAKIKGIPQADALKRLAKGVMVDGKLTSKANVKLLKQNTSNQTAVVELTIHEGWNHQVKKMFEAIGHPVIKLKREAFAFLNLDKMQAGDWRYLTSFEVDKLRKMSESGLRK